MNITLPIALEEHDGQTFMMVGGSVPVEALPHIIEMMPAIRAIPNRDFIILFETETKTWTFSKKARPGGGRHLYEKARRPADLDRSTFF